MLRTKIKKLLIKMALIFTLTASILIPNLTTHKMAYANTYDNIQQVQEVKQEYDILIYHSHTHEAYVDYNIVDAGNDLATKLEKKGLKVKVINDVFDSNYNNSYYASRSMLQSELQKNNYKLIIDMHRDSTGGSITTGTNRNGDQVAKTMFVLTTESPNYQENKKVVNELKSSIDKFGNDMTRSNWEYRKGINFYNGDLGNLILVEMGFQNNDSLSVKRANTYLSSAIARYIYANF